MALTTAQKQLIIQLDQEAKQILRESDEEALLMSLCYKINTINDIIASAEENELNPYYEQYDGFYQYMHLLERLAEGIADGIFDDILKK